MWWKTFRGTGVDVRKRLHEGFQPTEAFIGFAGRSARTQNGNLCCDQKRASAQRLAGIGLKTTINNPANGLALMPLCASAGRKITSAVSFGP